MAAMKRLLICFCALLLALHAAEPAPVDFTVKLATMMKHDDGKFLWFHPRAAAIPGRGVGGPAAAKKILANCKLIYKMQSHG